MGRIAIVGTGWVEGQLTLEAAEALSAGAKVILHTERCGCAEWLRGEGIPFESLDALYESTDDFDAHVRAAVQRVLETAEGGDAVYAVADVRDRTARALAAAAPGARIVAGPPVEGPLPALCEGQTLAVEASDWQNVRFEARENCLIRELDNRELAAEIKLKLMEVYPEECAIWLYGAHGLRKMPLYELDRAEAYDHRTCALIPAQREITRLERYDFEHLNEIMRLLCGPGGCPWDRAQTHRSLRTCMLEEAYEAMDAIDEDDMDHLYDELGDLMLQIALNAEIARRHGEFDISDVTTAICEKMIHRHSHIFGDDKAGDPEQVMGIWSRNKMAERGQTTHTEALRDVTRALPAQLRAVKVLKRSGDVGLCETDAAEALRVCAEKLEKVPADGDAEEALGDALMAVSDVARLLKVDPEIALNGAVNRFIRRFESVEGEIIKKYGRIEALSQNTLREYWDLVKL